MPSTLRLSLTAIFLLLLFGCTTPPVPPGTIATPDRDVPAGRDVPTERLYTPSPTVTAASLPTATAAPKKGGELREAIAREGVSFHPYLATDATSALYQANVYARGLTVLDPQTLQPAPNMAQSWTVSADGRTYTFKLRQDLHWSDGDAITAQDFQWTFDKAFLPANRYPFLDQLKEISSYKAKDPSTLEVVLKQPACTGLTYADAIVPLPKHIWEKLDWRDPAKNPEIAHPSVVSGPFKLQEWQKGDHIGFVRNDAFFRGASYLDAIKITIVPDSSARLALLRSGAVDVAPIDGDHYAAAKQSSLLQEYHWEPAAATLDYIGLNLRRSILQDVQMRRALALATPRRTIVDQIFHGLGSAADSLYPSSSWAYSPDVTKYDYNIEAAKALLSQAGYRLNASGALVDKQSKPIHLSIVYNADNQQYVQIAQIVQAEYDKLGIAVDLNGLDYSSLVDHLSSPPFDFDLFILGWEMPIDPSLMNQVWDEKSIPDLNPGAYTNKEVSNLFVLSNRPPCDIATRKTSLQKIQTLLATDVPDIFLTFRTGYAFVNQRIAPNLPARLGIRYLPEQWYAQSSGLLNP